jgi:hypothetical protein
MRKFPIALSAVGALFMPGATTATQASLQSRPTATRAKISPWSHAARVALPSGLPISRTLTSVTRHSSMAPTTIFSHPLVLTVVSAGGKVGRILRLERLNLLTGGYIPNEQMWTLSSGSSSRQPLLHPCSPCRVLRP